MAGRSGIFLAASVAVLVIPRAAAAEQRRRKSPHHLEAPTMARILFSSTHHMSHPVRGPKQPADNML